MISAQQNVSSFSDPNSVHPREREYQAHYRAYFFGPFRLLRENTSIGKQMRRRSKAVALLKWFLLNPGKLISADELLDLLWPEMPAETALCNLHVSMHYLRHLLQPDLANRQESKFVRRQPNNFYWFDLDETWWADILDVPLLFDSARSYERCGNECRAAFYHRKVISYCSLGFLSEDTPEPWSDPYIRRYEYMYSRSLQSMIQLCKQKGELEESMEYAYQALAIDPYCELATKAIIDMYLQQGNVIAASRALNDYCDFFQQTLGIEPGRDFHLLRDRIIESSD